MRRAFAARDQAIAVAGQSVVDSLTNLVAKARPTINMPVAVCDDILRSDKYRTYDQRVDNFERVPASEKNHADRLSVGTRLFPRAEKDIVYAALSPNGDGLLNYGPIAVQWEVTAAYLEPRISLLDENSYSFFVHYKLGEFDCEVPEGHRAIWNDRLDLIIAKLGPSLTIADTDEALAVRLLSSASSLDADEFIEIHIFADEGLDADDVIAVRVQGALSSEDELRFRLVKEICNRTRANIAISYAKLGSLSHVD